ncbi:MAG: ABC transporter ATP-binding protein [Betaproteobacteria bacterium]
MARIELAGIAHSYKPNPSQASDYALRPMEMTWQDGGAYALLGPSGCGKTTLLNIISGLITPSQGKVLFDGHDVTQLPPEKRNIAQVFQFPVIYDTMTVGENLAFPLKNRGWKNADIERRVAQIAEILELSGELKQRASGLTADAKQKISLGRGLVRPDVAAVLFDEPLTVIDPHLKWLLRRKLKEIHHELKLSLIYVTNDQIEALTFADQVVVMTEGEVVQIGSAQALFEAPEHTFVGYFIGNPGMNLLPCSLRDGRVLISGTDSSLPAPASLDIGAGQLTLGVRPEYVECLPTETAGALPTRVLSARNMGTHWLVEGELGGHRIASKQRTHHPTHSGDTVWMKLPADRTLYYLNDKRVA